MDHIKTPKVKFNWFSFSIHSDSRDIYMDEIKNNQWPFNLRDRPEWFECISIISSQSSRTVNMHIGKWKKSPTQLLNSRPFSRGEFHPNVLSHVTPSILSCIDCRCVILPLSFLQEKMLTFGRVFVCVLRCVCWVCRNEFSEKRKNVSVETWAGWMRRREQFAIEYNQNRTLRAIT